MYLSQQEVELCALLRDHPRKHSNIYDEHARNDLIQILFHALATPAHLQTLFHGPPPPVDSRWSLRKAQGAVEGAEYTEGARGHPCGHIFKNGETTYRCRTCSDDDTCVLCARCFEASEHEGHNVFVSLSPGNSGCCDCGDPEAWLREVECGIHSLSAVATQGGGKAPARGPILPPELAESIRMTISRAMDYMCDVFSCSPEQLRLSKTEETVRDDELKSRLPARVYSTPDIEEEDTEFALVLWNDEKHTVQDVRDQVSRACKISPQQAYRKGLEVDDVGRSILVINKDLPLLLHAARVIEQPKLTVTIRSARDTFREQMCATIIEWIADIAGCSVGPDANILRDTICEQFLRPWRVGSEAHHQEIGKDGLDDHEVEDIPDDFFRFHGRYPAQAAARFRRAWGDDEEEEADDTTEDESPTAAALGDEMDIDTADYSGQDMDLDVDAFDDTGPLEASEATLAGYPPPPPPPPQPRRRYPGVASDSDDASFQPMTVPRTPKGNAVARSARPPRPPKHWLEKPALYRQQQPDLPVAENLAARVRLDYLILWDLRMWKQLRTNLRDVLISTVVTLPRFKRLLGLRFAGVYTVLAELYLIADREPDHSIINLSLQMLTTPSITTELLSRANFLANLLAILYTFLTTRQVGYPSDVNPSLTLAFDQGAVTNRRTYHFYMDLKYLLQSESVRERVRAEDRYLCMWLDLATLHQGICPNVRAVGEHVEFENDSWLSASIIVQEIIKLCKLIGECFAITNDEDADHLCRAIRTTARTVTINSLGVERDRFRASEIKSATRFKTLSPFEFEEAKDSINNGYEVVDYTLASEHVSFHHALHYTLSWLVDRGKTMPRERLIELLSFNASELKPAPPGTKLAIPDTTAQQNLLALFDFPLRVLAWLAQMRAGMWVRNGITLRHQMGAYRGHQRRELSFFRDIFMLQTAFVVLPPGQVLASMIDRFGLSDWIRGDVRATTGSAGDEQQKLDVAEDFVHLLIILLTDRVHLQPLSVDPHPQVSVAKRDITHTLCFKPLSFSSLCAHIPDKFSDTDEFDQLIQDMTDFRPPISETDTGTFALKDAYYEEIDPYLAHFSRNQRDEAENIYKKHMAKKTGKDIADIVYEPRLKKIEAGLFKDLPDLARTPLFAQIVFYLLQYALVADRFAPGVPGTKVEQFLGFVLHLTLIAVLEDEGDAMPKSSNGVQSDSFCRLALTKQAKYAITAGNGDTIARLLRRIAEDETFKSCAPKVELVLKHLRQKRPVEWTQWMRTDGLPDERSQNASPTPDLAQDKELKKKQALERQAKVMAQFKQQQNSFMQNQAIDWGDDDFSDLDVEEEYTTPAEQQLKLWHYPGGTCILCQEETNEEKLYGSFALITESRLCRNTPLDEEDWVAEALESPDDLDRSAESIRPYGVAGKNRRRIVKVGPDGRAIETERQDLAKGFPMRTHATTGALAGGCGHIMHYNCFEVYVQATQRRQQAAIARRHPENLDQKEFLCPMCKALGNAFLPVIWRGKPMVYPGVLAPEDGFEQFLARGVGVHISKMEKLPLGADVMSGLQSRLENLFLDYGKTEMLGSIAGGLSDLRKPAIMPAASSTSPTDATGARQYMLNSLNMMFADANTAGDIIPSTSLFSNIPGGFVDPLATLPSMNPQLTELVRIYQRLKDTMTTNGLSSMFRYPAIEAGDMTHTDTLAKSLGYSIAAAEIGQRGVESDGANWLEKLSVQTLSNLRVLAETALSYFAVGALRNGGDNITMREFTDIHMAQLRQLFVGHPEVCSLDELMAPLTDNKADSVLSRTPLLAQDPFLFLASTTVFTQPALRLDPHHLLRMTYLAEVIRVIIAFMQTRSRLPTMDHTQVPGQISTFDSFVGWICKTLAGLNPSPGTYDFERLQNPALLRLVRAYTLPFLRKALLLFTVRYGVDFGAAPAVAADPEDVSQDEISRLSRALRLPTLDDLIIASLEGGATLSIMTGWVSHWALYRRSSVSTDTLPIQLSHPAIYELVGLPKNFDSLQDEAMKRKCPRTGKDQTDPVICLFCGEIFCSQAVCCRNDDNKGGAWQHRVACSGPTSLLINIRKCMVLMLNGESGSWSYAPYLDKHGETDPTLRRHHQLFLSQRRYDKLLREIWLRQGVESAIARRLEGESNNGGWESL